jgi:signal transduction histidine kinase
MIAMELEPYRWPERRTKVKLLAEQIAQEGPSEETITALQALAGDPKWEVRKEVADHLPMLQNGEFAKLAAMLVDDSHAFVSRAARRALKRRQREMEAAARKQRSLKHLDRQYARFEKRYGTEAVRQARRLAEGLYDVLVGATVHDMRNVANPLRSLLVGLETQIADYHVESHQALGKMRRYVDWLQRMLDDMKTYSQCTPTGRACQRVEAVVEEAAAMARDTLQAAGRPPRGVTLHVDVPGAMTFVVSRDHLVRALANLIKNAYEAYALGPTRYEPGTVWIRAQAVDARWLEIIIQDHGAGLGEDDLEEVRRFVPGGTSKAEGTGFGLPTAKRMLEAHGGSLSIESQDGQGTVVTVTMPTTTPGGIP